MKEIFLIPMEIVTGGSPFGTDLYRPKYVTGISDSYGVLRFSRIDGALVCVDATAANLAQIESQPDVIRLASETDLDEIVPGSEIGSIKSFLESQQIPAQGINVGDSRRQVIRNIAGIFLFAQRTEGLTDKGLNQNLTETGAGLNSNWQSLTQAAKDVILNTVSDEGWADTDFSGPQTVRQLLNYFSSKYETTPISINGIKV